MMNEKVLGMLNEQMNREFYSWYLYLSVSTYFNSLDLEGFEQWTRRQAIEETQHAMKIYGYLLERNGQVVLSQIPEPTQMWNSPLDAVQAVYNHECELTGRINDIVRVTREVNDYSTEVFLHWFITEQREEEAMASRVLQKLKMIGNDMSGLLMLDAQVASVGQAEPTE
ncbi:MAG: ferritin [Candidatus Kapaibacterium sp.]